MQFRLRLGRIADEAWHSRRCRHPSRPSRRRTGKRQTSPKPHRADRPLGRRSASAIFMRGGDGPIGGLQAHLEKLQQVVRRRTKRAGAGKRRKVPVRDGRKTRVVAARQTLLHRTRKRDARVVHAERRANARDDQLLIALAAAQFEDMAEQAEAEIGIFVMLARLEAELVVRQVVVEPLGGVIDVGIAPDPSARNSTASAAGPTCRSQDQAA